MHRWTPHAVAFDFKTIGTSRKTEDEIERWTDLGTIWLRLESRRTGEIRLKIFPYGGKFVQHRAALWAYSRKVSKHIDF